MTVDTNTMISITEANQNFSKVARVVDEHGTAVILKNNVPRYLVIDFSKVEQEKIASTEDVFTISERLIKQNMEAVMAFVMMVFLALNGYELSYTQKELSYTIIG